MTIFAGKAFTQYTDLNITDELRIKGVLVNPGGGQDIVTVTSGNYTQEIDDDVIIMTGAATLSLIQASGAVKSITIKSKLPGGDITITPFAGDTVNATASLTVSAGTSQVLAPIATDWEVLG